MKERIVIEGKEPKEVIIKLVKASSIKMYEELERTDRICIYGEELKRIKVPENFADLLTLCKNTKGCCVLRAGDREYIEVPTTLTGYSFTFHESGNIFFYEDICVLEKATPARQWQIIKSLIGEE